MGGEPTGDHVQAQVPTCPYLCMLTKAVIGFVLIAVGGRVRISRRCRQWLNNLERKHWTARHETPFDEGGSRRSWVYGCFETGSHIPIKSAANAGVVVRSEFLDFSGRRDTPITGLRSGQRTVHARKQRLYVPDEQQTSL